MNVINECKVDEYSCNCLYIKHALDNLVIIFDDEIVNSTINRSISNKCFFLFFLFLLFPVIFSVVDKFCIITKFMFRKLQVLIKPRANINVNLSLKLLFNQMCVMVYKIVAIKTIRFNKTEIVSVKEILIEIILWV